MAENFLQYSATVDNLTNEEAKWFEYQLEDVIAPDGYTCPRILLDRYDEFSTGCLSASIEIDENGSHYLWIYAEDSGEPYAVGILMQKFLREFRPHDSWGMTFAATCSKMRPDEFDGGYLFVTADDIEVVSASDMLAEKMKRRYVENPDQAGSDEHGQSG